MKAIIHRIVGASLVFLSGALAAQIPCSVDVLGLPGVDPVTIVAELTLPPDCTLDFGDREVVLDGTLHAVNLTLIAGRLSTSERSLIDGGAGDTTLVLQQGRLHDGSAEIRGSLTNDELHGGGIVVLAAGGVTATATARLEASAQDPAGYGGFIGIEAVGDISFLDDGTPITALGGENAEFNGEVSIVSRSGAVSLGGGIVVSGGTLIPGAVTIDAATGLKVQGAIRAAGRCASGVCSRGGVVRLSSSSTLDVLAPVDARGADGSVDPGDADGGSVRIDAAGDVTVAADALLAAGELGRGGTFDAYAGGTFKQAGVTIDAGGRAPTSSGGSIILSAGKEASISGGLLAGGGPDGEAGSIRITAEDRLAIAGALSSTGNYPTTGIELVSVNDAIQVTAAFDARGRGDFGTGGPIGIFAVTAIDLQGASFDASGDGPNGLGGPVRIDSFQSVHLGARSSIITDGSSQDPGIGEGGTIDIKACQVAIDAGVTLHATGATGGTISITSSDGMSLPAEFRAPSDGLIQLKFPPDLPPDLEGGTFDPAPTLVPTDLVDPCALPTTCDPVTGLACSTQGASATLTWQRSASSTEVQVLRDGAVVATLGPEVETFGEGGLAPGPHTYLVQGTCRGRPAGGASCEVTVSTDVPFLRGDCDVSGDRDITDGISVLGYLFLGLPRVVKCEKACDCNDDGVLDVSDAVFLLAFLFTDPTKIPPSPFERCGLDLKPDDLPCESFGACRQ